MDRMHWLADDLREMFSERGHAISVALDTDTAFRRSRRPMSAMVRELVLEGVERGTTRRGLGCRPAQGGGVDVQLFVDGVDRRYRVRKATKHPETGEFVILQASDSIMTVTEAEPDTLFRTERWVLGYTVTDDGLLGEIFEAQVLGISSAKVPELLLTQVSLLGSGPVGTGPSTGFRPADEDQLDDLDDAEDEEGEESAAN